MSKSKSEASDCCCSCKFWNAPETGTTGQCRAHPPTVVVRAAAESAFPLTEEADWCGEFVAGGTKAHEAHGHAKSAH